MAHDPHNGHGDHSHHVLGKKMLFSVFGGLVFLTIATGLTIYSGYAYFAEYFRTHSALDGGRYEDGEE